MKNFFNRLLQKLNLTLNEAGIALPGKLRRQMQDIAAEQGRPEGEVTSELLAAELEKQAAGNILPRWRTLTPTERTIARLIAEGCSNSQISEKLKIASETVRTHIRNIKLKYGIHQIGALREAIRRELGAAAHSDSDLIPK